MRGGVDLRGRRFDSRSHFGFLLFRQSAGAAGNDASIDASLLPRLTSDGAVENAGAIGTRDHRRIVRVHEDDARSAGLQGLDRADRRIVLGRHGNDRVD